MPISMMSLNSLNPRCMASTPSEAPHIPTINDSTNAVVTEHKGLISKENHGDMDASSTELMGSVSVINDGKTATPHT